MSLPHTKESGIHTVEDVLAFFDTPKALAEAYLKAKADAELFERANDTSMRIADELAGDLEALEEKVSPE